MSATTALQLRVHSITYEASDILSFDLRAPNGAELPPFTAGAHIDLQLPGGLVRSYSLVNPQHERQRYLIAVNRDRASRGGSRYMHDSVKAGATIAVTPPRNNFPLDEMAAESLFIAGGIGITPIMCMIERLTQLGRAWKVHYSTRTRQNAAFLNRLGELEAAARCI